MAKFTDLMIDLETLGNRPNSVVVSIGAVFFNPETGDLGDKFEQIIDLQDAMRYGKVDGSTLKWWLKQSDAARRTLVEGVKSAVDVWEAFYKFAGLHGKDVHPWGNGSSFDLTMCGWQFGAVLNKVEPWQFWRLQDCRTIKRVADGIIDYTDKLEGTAHTALADAIHQARYVSAYWSGLRSRALASAPISNVAAVVPESKSNDASEEDIVLDLD